MDMTDYNLFDLFLSIILGSIPIAIFIIFIRFKRKFEVQKKLAKVYFYKKQVEDLLKTNQFHSALKILEYGIKETNEPSLKLLKNKIVLNRVNLSVQPPPKIIINSSGNDEIRNADLELNLVNKPNEIKPFEKMGSIKKNINTSNRAKKKIPNSKSNFIFQKIENDAYGYEIDRSNKKINLLRDSFENNSIEYSEVLRNVKWKSKREEVIDRDKFQCVNCHNKNTRSNPLQVHHKYYIKGRLPWEYFLFAFETLCKKCHKDWHIKNDVKLYWIAKENLVGKILNPCTRCNGIGYLHEYKHVDNGICFKCKGTKFE